MTKVGSLTAIQPIFSVIPLSALCPRAVARMERSAIRDGLSRTQVLDFAALLPPQFAALHAGYK
jgi:hypothetical protein